MINIDLKACAHCGSDAQTDFIEGESYIIECSICLAQTGAQDAAEDAIAAWNRRAAQPAQPASAGSIGDDVEFIALMDEYDQNEDSRRSITLVPLIAYIDSRPRQADQEDDSDAESEWRRLALQFDGHRMQAIGHLKCMVKDPQAHKGAAEQFLSAGPISGEEVLAERIKAISTAPRQAVQQASAEVRGAGELPESRLLHRDNCYGYEEDQMIEFGAQQREAGRRERDLDFGLLELGLEQAHERLSHADHAIAERDAAALAQQAPDTVRDDALDGDMAMIQYEHGPKGATTFKQYKKDPVPAWAHNVREYTESNAPKLADALPVKMGCHCDLEEGMEPDGCVIESGRLNDCVRAKVGMAPRDCEFWMPIVMQSKLADGDVSIADAVQKMYKGYRSGAGYYNEDEFVDGLHSIFKMFGHATEWQ